MIKYTDKQRKGLKTLNNKDNRFILFDGGSRSGKTVLICLWYVMRCIKYPGTRRLIARLTKMSCKDSVWSQTLLDILNFDRFKGTHKAYEDKIKFNNGSEIWQGGFDNKLHEDHVLGQEWDDMWINEATDIKYDRFGKLKTRLNTDPIYKQKHNYEGHLIFDCNPKGTGHFLNKMFNKGINPSTGKPLDVEDNDELGRLWWHPSDNKDNLDPKYFSSLSRSDGLNRKRFWDGVWSDQVEHAVFRFDRKVNVTEERYKYQPGEETWCSLDFGVSDPTSIIWYQIVQVPPTKENLKGLIIYIFDEYENNNKPVSHYGDLINAKGRRDVDYCGDPSGKNRNESLDSWISKFREYGIHIKTKTGHSRVELIDNSNEWIKYVRINEEQCPKTVEMFENWELETSSDEKPKEGIPKHDEYSHLGTSFYYFMINKYPIRKPSTITIN